MLLFTFVNLNVENNFVEIYEHYQKPVLEFFIFSKTQKMV